MVYRLNVLRGPSGMVEELDELEEAEQDGRVYRTAPFDEGREKKTEVGGDAGPYVRRVHRLGRRAVTESIKRLSKRELAIGASLFPPDLDEPMPARRAHCEPAEKTCPYCNQTVVMRVAGDADVATHVECPKCTGHVKYRAARDGGYLWERVQPGERVEPPPMSALHQCRPCMRVSCSANLFLDVNRQTGSIKYNFPDLSPHQMRESCMFDVASRDGLTLEEVGEIINLTRERVRQLETRGLLKVKAFAELASLQDYLDDTPGVPKTHRRKFCAGNYRRPV
jgi:hypothetical protein